MNGSDALLRSIEFSTADLRFNAVAQAIHNALGVNRCSGTHSLGYATCQALAVAALRAALNATPEPADPVAAFLDSIPDDGLPARIGDHYRVVTVCGHCGEVWSKLAALDATNEHEHEVEGETLTASGRKEDCAWCSE